MENGADSEEETLCKPFVFTVLWAFPLSLFVVSVIVFLSLGVPALRATGFGAANCSTQFVEFGESRTCSYDCGNDLEQCEKEYWCRRVHVLADKQQEKTSVLAWDIEAGIGGYVECSNYPDCRYRGIIKLYGRPGSQYKCYFDPSRPDVAILKAPPSPLPYVLAPPLALCLVVIFIILIRQCGKEQTYSLVGEKGTETSNLSKSDFVYV